MRKKKNKKLRKKKKKLKKNKVKRSNKFIKSIIKHCKKWKQVKIF